MSTVALPHKNGSAAVAPADSWLLASVQKFFTGINWEDNPPEVQEIRMAAASEAGATSLNMTMSVCQFFAAVNWDGTEIAAAPAPVVEPVSKPDDLTLDDFSSLF